jgi:hypothetical protein
MGIRRLIELGLDRLHEPTVQCVRAVDRVLQSMVERAVDRQAGLSGGGGGARGVQKVPSSGKLSLAGGSAGIGMGGGGGGGGEGVGEDLLGEALRRFPALRSAVTAAALAALERHKREAEAMVTGMVDMEASYFDADFFRRFSAGGGFEDPSNPSPINGNGDGNGNPASADPAADPFAASNGGGGGNAGGIIVGSGPDAHLRLIAASVYAYVDAVRARMAKTVPKAVVHCQVGLLLL